MDFSQSEASSSTIDQSDTHLKLCHGALEPRLLDVLVQLAQPDWLIQEDHLVQRPPGPHKLAQLVMETGYRHLRLTLISTIEDALL